MEKMGKCTVHGCLVDSFQTRTIQAMELLLLKMIQSGTYIKMDNQMVLPLLILRAMLHNSCHTRDLLLLLMAPLQVGFQ